MTAARTFTLEQGKAAGTLGGEEEEVRIVSFTFRMWLLIRKEVHAFEWAMSVSTWS